MEKESIWKHTSHTGATGGFDLNSAWWIPKFQAQGKFPILFSHTFPTVHNSVTALTLVRVHACVHVCTCNSHRDGNRMEDEDNTERCQSFIVVLFCRAWRCYNWITVHFPNKSSKCTMRTSMREWCIENGFRSQTSATLLDAKPFQCAIKPDHKTYQ